MAGPTNSKGGVKDRKHEGRQPNELVWFSHLEKEFQVVNIGLKKFVQWKEEEPPKMWDWDNCMVSRAKALSDGKVRIVIRSKTNRNSDYMGNIPVELRFMLGIDIASISKPYSEPYQLATSKRKNLPFSAKKTRHKRWVCKLDERYWIWQWSKDGVDMKSSRIYQLYEDIRNFLEDARNGQDSVSGSSKKVSNIFRVSLNERLDEIVPIIYQPAIDSLKNFLREVHCAKVVGDNSTAGIEVTLLFNNEELREHKYLDRIYSKIRLFLYGRTRDVETFRIYIVKNMNGKPQNFMTHSNVINEEKDNRSEEKRHHKSNKNNTDNYFVFEGIYSGQFGIEHDTIHLDTPPAPKRPIEYYFLDHYHPIIFINTANHAMSEHDNNHDIWKWEYIPWIKKAPLKLGFKSRKDIDRRFTPWIRRILKLAS